VTDATNQHECIALNFITYHRSSFGSCLCGVLVTIGGELPAGRVASIVGLAKCELDGLRKIVCTYILYVRMP
jgi:hypothetical protein